MRQLALLFNNLITKGLEYFGRYYSSYRGWVIDNNDPDGYGRVKIKCPQVYGTQTYDYWAWPKGQFSGNGYGMQCTPQKGEMIYVEFEMGDPKKPIWSYGHFGKTPGGQKEKPAELKDLGNFWFKTPGGHLIELDDTNKAIKITNKKGFYILLDETGASVVADNISLIKENGASPNEPALLGDKTETTLNSIKGSLDTIQKLLQQIATADATGVSALSSMGVTLSYTSLMASTSAQLLLDIQTLTNNISEIKSTKVTLS